MRFLPRFLPLGVALVLLAGCGQKGPLFLRDNPPPGQEARKSERYEPIPDPAPEQERR